MKRIVIIGRTLAERVRVGLEKRIFAVQCVFDNLQEFEKLPLADAPDAVVICIGEIDAAAAQIEAAIKVFLPIPVVLISGNPKLDTDRIYAGINAGAFGFVDLQMPDESALDLLAAKLNLCIGESIAAGEKLSSASPKEASRCAVPIVAIGSSTGGPSALAEILSDLPADFKGACAIVQHLDFEFSGSFAEWLAKVSALPLEIAQDGCAIQAGKVYLSNAGYEFTVTADGKFKYERSNGDDLFCPSINLFFESLLNYPRKGCAILLTGMGRDGADGLLSLKLAGWRTIAQDEASSAVYGMPKAAAKMGAATEILAIEKIGKRAVSIIDAM